MLQRSTVNRSPVGVVQKRRQSNQVLEEAPDWSRIVLAAVLTVFQQDSGALLGFTLPTPYHKGTKNVLDFFTDFNLSTITNELV